MEAARAHLRLASAVEAWKLSVETSYFDYEHVEAMPGREVLEAIAAACKAILDGTWHVTHGTGTKVIERLDRMIDDWKSGDHSETPNGGMW